MDAIQFYCVIEENYDEVLERLRKPERIVRFAKMFLDDESFKTIEQAIKQNNVELAFRSAHTLKGISANLGFQKLYKASNNLTEYLRPLNDVNCGNLFDSVKKEYEKIVSAINELE